MIKIDNVRNLKNNKGFEHLIIVRSMKNPIADAIQEACLSPSKQLFFDYLSWKKEGIWDKKCFEERYVPRFLQEILSNREATDLLFSLLKRSKTDDIALYCFCPEEELCHRSVVAGLLLGAGADVDCNEDYKKYWDQYKKLLNKN